MAMLCDDDLVGVHRFDEPVLLWDLVGQTRNLGAVQVVCDCGVSGWSGKSFVYFRNWVPGVEVLGLAGLAQRQHEVGDHRLSGAAVGSSVIVEGQLSQVADVVGVGDFGDSGVRAPVYWVWSVMMTPLPEAVEADVYVVLYSPMTNSPSG